MFKKTSACYRVNNFYQIIIFYIILTFLFMLKINLLTFYRFVNILNSSYQGYAFAILIIYIGLLSLLGLRVCIAIMYR